MNQHTKNVAAEHGNVLSRPQFSSVTSKNTNVSSKSSTPEEVVNSTTASTTIVSNNSKRVTHPASSIIEHRSSDMDVENSKIVSKPFVSKDAKLPATSVVESRGKSKEKSDSVESSHIN